MIAAIHQQEAYQGAGKSLEKEEKLAHLRRTIARLEGGLPRQQEKEVSPPSLRSFLRALRRDGLHEIGGEGLDREEAVLPLLFALMIIASWQGPFVWIAERADGHALGLRALGFDPGSVLFVKTPSNKESLWALEEVLRSGTIGVALAEIGDLPLKASRRLQLAAEGSGTTGLIVRRFRIGGDSRPEAEPIAALTRWRVKPLLDQDLERGIGMAVDLWRQKGGAPYSWRLSFDQGVFHEISLPVAQSFSDRLLAAR